MSRECDHALSKLKPPALPGDTYLEYGPNIIDQYRQAAVYVDRILRGTKAGDLPVQIATKFSLGINLKAARDLGIEVPLSLLLIADELVE